MKTLLRTALDIQRLFEKKKWRFCFIGGVALQRWGEPRLTVDVDVSLLTGFGQEEAFIDALLAEYPARISHAARFALKNRVLLLKSEGGIGIDISLAGLPFEEEVIRRATFFNFLPGIRLRTCSAEDLIVLKAFADRPKDWVDIDGILVRGRRELDKRYIFSRLQPLSEIKEEPGIPRKLKALFAER